MTAPAIKLPVDDTLAALWTAYSTQCGCDLPLMRAVWDAAAEAADPGINESGEAPMQKVTVQQAAWVIQHFADNLNRPGSFRKVIYDRMGYGPEAYQPLYEAGGMALTNGACELEEWNQIQKAALGHGGISILQDESAGWKIETGDKNFCGTGKTLECAIDMFSIAVDKADAATKEG